MGTKAQLEYQIVELKQSNRTLAQVRKDLKLEQIKCAGLRLQVVKANEASSRAQGLAMDRADSRSEAASLKSKLATAVDWHQRYVTEAGPLKSENEALKSKLATALRTHQADAVSVADLKAEAASLKSKLATALRTHQADAVSVADLKAEVTVLKSKLEAVSKERKGLLSDVELLSAALAHSVRGESSKIAAAAKESADLRSEVTSLKSKLAAVGSRSGSSVIAGLKAEVSRLNRELAAK